MKLSLRTFAAIATVTVAAFGAVPVLAEYPEKPVRNKVTKVICTKKGSKLLQTDDSWIFQTS